jgi:hypothetical protein
MIDLRKGSQAFATHDHPRWTIQKSLQPKKLGRSVIDLEENQMPELGETDS